MRAVYSSFLALLAAAPAVYAWWSGRAVRRAIDDPALPELLLARLRRIAQVTIVVIIASAFMTAPSLFSAVVLFGVLAAQYPIRRAVYGDTWSFWQYVRFTSFSWIAFGGLWLFPFIASGVVVQLVQAWMPEPSPRQTILGLALGIVAAVVYLVWHRNFTRVWLALHHASPLDVSDAHAALLPRFDAVLARAGDKVPARPSVHRYGMAGGQIVNAVALCSLKHRAVAMSDTLLGSLDADEATAVFAHELAHHEHYTDALLRKRRVASFVLALLLAVIPALHLATASRYGFAIDVLFLAAILAFFARGQQGHRTHETQCDLRAVDLTGDAEAVIRGLTKIHALSRVPRRFSQEFERAATHPSLAHRIQAIRAHASIVEQAPDGPTVVATTTPGSYVALDGTRSYWFDGAPADAPLDLAVLREQAASYRALTYPELGELRLAAETPRVLRAVDLAGRSWSVGIHDEDVGRVQAALDRVDARLGVAPAPRVATSDNTARTVAALLLLATMMAGVFGLTTFIAMIAVFAPSAAALAATAAMTIASVVVTIAEGSEQLIPYESLAQAVVVVAALWAAWIAWRWYRNARDGRSREVVTRSASRWSYALRIGLTIGVLISILSHTIGGVSSPAALLGDPGTSTASIALLGSGAAMLTARRRGVRLGGAGLAALSVLGIAAGTFGDRWVASPTGIAWTTRVLAPVASVPVGGDVYRATLSPAGTRYLTQRYVGDGDGEEDKQGLQMTTGSVSPGGPTHTFTALDAVLPNEREALVLARAGDSLELRLERHDGYSTARVAWRRMLPPLAGAQLRLDAPHTRWLVHGRRSDGERYHLATISGALDGADVREVDVPMDTLRGQVLFSYGDGAALVLGATPRLTTDFAGRSLVATYISALRGTAVTWTLWRFDRDGSRAVKSIAGYPTCASAAEPDAAICVEQGMRSTRFWRVERDSVVDLGNLARRYDRATASDGGTVVASSYRGHAIAIVEPMQRRGVHTALPAKDYSYVREISASDSTVVALLSGQQGMRLAVYRLR